MFLPRRPLREAAGRDAAKRALRPRPWGRFAGLPLVGIGAAVAAAAAGVLLAGQPPAHRAAALVRVHEGGAARPALRGDGVRVAPAEASEAALLQGRAALEALVRREGLRLVDPAIGEPPAWASDVTVRLPDDEGLEVALRFGPSAVRAAARGDAAEAAYGEPLTLRAVRMTVRRPPADHHGRLRVEPLQAALDRTADRLRLRSIDDSDAVEISFTARDPGVARRVVDAAAQVLEWESARAARLRAQRRRVVLEERVRSQDSSLALARRALDSLRAVAPVAAPVAAPEERRAVRRVSDLEVLGERLSRAYEEARFEEAVDGGRIEVVRLAATAVPVPKRAALKLLLAALVGAVLGGGLSAARGRSGQPIRDREDLEETLDIRTLAVIPRMEPEGTSRGLRRLARGVAGRRSNGERADGGRDGADRPGRLGRGGGRAARRAPLDAAARAAGTEAFRALRTNLLFSRATSACRSVLVTSPGPSEGRTTTVANLGAVIARQGIRVLLLDADLRRGELARRFGLPRAPGLAEVLLGEVELSKAVRRTDRRGLALLPSGLPPDNPAELLGGSRMEALMRSLSERYDLVLVDGPPVLLASEAAVLATLVEGVLLVVRCGETEREAARHALAQLVGVDARVLGGVLNEPRTRASAHQAYYRRALRSELEAT